MNAGEMAIVPTQEPGALTKFRVDVPTGARSESWSAIWNGETKRAEITLPESDRTALAPIADVVDTAEALEIRCPEDRAMIVEWVRAAILGGEALVASLFDEPAALAFGLHRGITALRGEYQGLLEQAKKISAAKVDAWDRHVEQLRREAEERVREEQERLERQARLEAFWPAVFWPLAAAVAEAAIRDQERQEAAAAAEQAGDAEAAEEMRATIGQHVPPPPQPELPIPTVAPVVLPPEPDKKGTSRRANWKAECFDLASLIRWVAQDIRSRMHLLEVNQAAADREAKNHGERLSQVIPGLKAQDRSKTHFRR